VFVFVLFSVTNVNLFVCGLIYVRLVVSTSAVNCLQRLVSDMTYYCLSRMLNDACSLIYCILILLILVITILHIYVVLCGEI